MHSSDIDIILWKMSFYIIYTIIPSWPSLWSPSKHFLLEYSPHQLLPHFLILSLHSFFLSVTASTASFDSLSILVTPSIFLRYLISIAWILLLCLPWRVRVSFPYNRIATTMALITLSLVALLSSFLLSPSTLPSPILPHTVPVHFHRRFSHFLVTVCCRCILPRTAFGCEHSSMLYVVCI